MQLTPDFLSRFHDNSDAFRARDDHQPMTIPESTPTPVSSVRPGSADALRLLNECRGAVQRFLSDAIQELFQKNDDTLFGFAEKSGGGEADSSGYFEAMRSLRLKKDAIVRAFLERMMQGFAGMQGPQAEQSATEVGEGEGHMTLSLLDESELEESLAIQSMAEKAEAACAGELLPLRHRLASLVGQPPFGVREDPVSPARLGEAYREALRVMEAGIEVRLVLYKLFDKFLLDHVDELYADLNRLLAKNGVMPEFKLQPRPERSRPRPRRSEETRRDDGEEETRGGGSGGNEGSDELLPLLRQLLTQQRGGGGGFAGGGGGGGPGGGGFAGYGGEGNFVAPEPQQVMAALTALQHQAVALQAQQATPVSPEQMRTAIAEQVKLAGQAAGTALTRQDSDLIDLVSMIFEVILDDRGIPDSVRVLLARLQIPMLKVALADRSFFSKASHPARRLLNMLAKAGIGLDDTLGADNSPRLAEIQRIVTRVLEDLGDNVGLFEELTQEFEAFLAREAEKEQAAEKRQTVTLRLREAREQIRAAVHHKIDELSAVQAVPASVDQLLRGPWTEVLIETRLGKEQALWPARTQLLRDMIISVTPKATREERLKLPALIAQMLSTLRTGLATIGWSAERIDAVIASIEPYHHAAVHGKAAPEPQAARPADPVDDMIAQMKAQMAEIAEKEHLEHIVDEPPPSSAIADLLAEDEEEQKDRSDGPLPPEEYLQLARTYGVGTWFTLTDPKGNRRRAKLTWKSELLGEWVFLDWRMKMVADLKLAQFARALADGSITELHDTPLFDRAMDALMGKLRGGKG